jgi:hypothetical protein
MVWNIGLLPLNFSMGIVSLEESWELNIAWWGSDFIDHGFGNVTPLEQNDYLDVDMRAIPPVNATHGEKGVAILAFQGTTSVESCVELIRITYTVGRFDEVDIHSEIVEAPKGEWEMFPYEVHNAGNVAGKFKITSENEDILYFGLEEIEVDAREVVTIPAYAKGTGKVGSAVNVSVKCGGPSFKHDDAEIKIVTLKGAEDGTDATIPWSFPVLLLVILALAVAYVFGREN